MQATVLPEIRDRGNWEPVCPMLAATRLNRRLKLIERIRRLGLCAAADRLPGMSFTGALAISQYVIIWPHPGLQ